MRAQRIKWWGRLNRKEITKTVRKITEWNAVEVRYKDVQNIDGKIKC
jgi:hypothetical protein